MGDASDLPIKVGELRPFELREFSPGLLISLRLAHMPAIIENCPSGKGVLIAQCHAVGHSRDLVIPDTQLSRVEKSRNQLVEVVNFPSAQIVLRYGYIR